MGGLVCALLGYLAVAFLVGSIVYVVSNPYGHVSKTSQWTKAITHGLGWPFMTIYLIWAWIYR